MIFSAERTNIVDGTEENGKVREQKTRLGLREFVGEKRTMKRRDKTEEDKRISWRITGGKKKCEDAKGMDQKCENAKGMDLKGKE